MHLRIMKGRPLRDFTEVEARENCRSKSVLRLTMPIAVAVLAAQISSLGGQTSVARMLARAAAAEKAGDYGSAVAEYSRVVAEVQAQHGPVSAIVGVRVRLAKDYFLLRQYQDSLRALKPLSAAFFRSRSSLAAQANLVAGMDNLEGNRPSQAIGNLQRTLAVDPESGTARLALGDAYARSNRFEDAARQYRLQLSRTPAVADAWYKLGVVYSHLSANTVRESERRNPANPIVQQLLAERLLEKHDNAEALRLFTAILREDPRQPGARAGLGRALFGLGHTRAAVKQFRAELAYDPESPQALLGIAEADSLSGNWEAVFRELSHLIRFHPQELRRELQFPPPKPLRDAWLSGHMALPVSRAQSPAGRLWTGWLKNSGAELEISSQQQEVVCGSPTATLAQTLGLWLTHSCYEKLREELETRNPSHGEALAKLTETEFRLGLYEKARDTSEIMARRQPLNGWAAYWRARSYSELAYSCFDRLSSLNPNSARIHEILAQLDAGRFQWRKAEEEYKSAIRLAPSLPDLHLGLGTVYWQAGNWQRAEEELEQTLKLDPASRVASYELGDSYIEQHRWPAAITLLERAATDPVLSYRARMDLAQAQEQTGDSRGALKNLLLVANEDRDGVLHYRLAMLYRKIGNSAREREALLRSQQLRRSSAQAAQQRVQRAEENLRAIPPPSPRTPRC